MGRRTGSGGSASGRHGPARWPLVVLALALLGAGAVAFVQGDDGDGGAEDEPPAVVPGEGTGPLLEEPLEVASEPAPGEPTPVVVERRPYVLAYRVEGSAEGDGAVIDTERRWVRPPFESRVETVPGEDDEADPTFLQIAGFGFLQTGREDEDPAVLAVEPAVAPGDARVDVRDLEWRHETMTVLDRTCQVFRTGSPIDVSDVAEPTEDGWTDLCVDERGLVLLEEWVIGGEVFRRRIAIELDEDPSLDDALFEPTGERPEGSRGGVLAEVTADSQPPGVAHYALPSPPAGFTHRGRYGFTPARHQTQADQPEASRVASILDVYEDGDGGIVVIANGGTSDNAAVVAPSDRHDDVDLGALGPADLVRGLRQQELRVAFERGRFLRVWATLPADDLVALARTLTPTTDPDSTVTPIS